MIAVPRPGHILPFLSWPEPDRAIWAAALQPLDLMSPTPALAEMSPAGRSMIKTGYGQWLSWLLSRGFLSPEASPAERVTDERFLQFIAERKQQVRGTSLLMLVDRLLRAYEIMDPQADWSLVRTVLKNCRALARQQGALSRAHVPIADLYSFGFELMERAQERINITARNALMFRDGLIISLLASVLVRRRNLLGMNIYRNLRWIDDQPHLEFLPEETKSGRYLLFSLPQELHTKLEIYLERCRPFLLSLDKSPMSHESNTLWFNRRGQEMSPAALTAIVRRRTLKRFGSVISPHHFRRCFATSIALSLPKNIGIAPGVLGHSNSKTTEEHYIRAGSVEAGRTHSSVVAKLRNDLKQLSTSRS